MQDDADNSKEEDAPSFCFYDTSAPSFSPPITSAQHEAIAEHASVDNTETRTASRQPQTSVENERGNRRTRITRACKVFLLQLSHLCNILSWI